LVLNRPTNSTVGEIWEMVSAGSCDSLAPLHLGGPVSGPLMALHTNPACSENEVIPGVHFSTQKENLNKIVCQPDQAFRIFSGYSGWAAGQLEGELKVGGWLTLQATREFVFADPEDLWKQVTEMIGEEITQPLLGRTKRPADPSQN
jgi:putative transcriptional regulator